MSALPSMSASLVLLCTATAAFLVVGGLRLCIHMARVQRAWHRTELDVLVDGIAFVAESHADRCLICGRPSDTPHVCREHFREDYPPPADRFSEDCQ